MTKAVVSVITVFMFLAVGKGNLCAQGVPAMENLLKSFEAQMPELSSLHAYISRHGNTVQARYPIPSSVDSTLPPTFLEIVIGHYASEVEAELGFKSRATPVYPAQTRKSRNMIIYEWHGSVPRILARDGLYVIDVWTSDVHAQQLVTKSFDVLTKQLPTESDMKANP